MPAGRKITLCVTGGIAAYKAAELASLLVKAGAEVNVAMTQAAGEFIRPLTFEVLTGNPVYSSMFQAGAEGEIIHINLAQTADLLVIVPATANIIGKAASGLADDLVSTLIMAATCPVLFCPAMNTAMYEKAAVQRNIAFLKDTGCHFVEPSEGRLACGTSGKGRLADLEIIYHSIKKLLTPQDLAGLKVLVTAGPTREPLDPVRYLSNRSSGKMGYALAEAAALRGADVTLVSGPTSLRPPQVAEFVKVETAEQMYKAVAESFVHSSVLIKAAAVADYRPKDQAQEKIKKQKSKMVISMEHNRDILAEMGRLKSPGQLLVGFAAETNDLEQNAREKLVRKNLDLLVANDVTQPGAGFDHDTNLVKIFSNLGEVLILPLMSKEMVAHKILDAVATLLQSAGGK